MCLLPSNYAGNEEEAVIEAISNSPGKFELLPFGPLYTFMYCIHIHIKINKENKDVVRSPSIFFLLILLGGR